MGKGQSGHIVLVVVAILVVGGLVAAGWYVWQSKSNKKSSTTSNTQQSANAGAEEDTTPDTSHIVNSELASNDFLAYASNSVTADFNCETLTVRKQLGDFVYAGVGSNDANSDGSTPAPGTCGDAGGGIGVLYKKQSGGWSEVWRGQDYATCSKLEQYGIPKEIDSIFEQCLQDGKLVPNTITAT